MGVVHPSNHAYSRKLTTDHREKQFQTSNQSKKPDFGLCEETTQGPGEHKTSPSAKNWKQTENLPAPRQRCWWQFYHAKTLSPFSRPRCNSVPFFFFFNQKAKMMLDTFPQTESKQWNTIILGSCCRILQCKQPLTCSCCNNHSFTRTWALCLFMLNLRHTSWAPHWLLAVTHTYTPPDPDPLSRERHGI